MLHGTEARVTRAKNSITEAPLVPNMAGGAMWVCLQMSCMLPFILLLDLFLISATLSVDVSRSDALQEPIRIVIQLRSQRTKERTWKQVVLEKGFSIGQNNKMLLNPRQVKVFSTGEVVVLDWGDRQIKKFSSDGKQLLKYGKGIGKGPGELTNPTDFVIDDQERVWVCDPVTGLLTIYDKRGNVSGTVRTKAPPYRIALMSQEYFVIVSAPIGETLFTVYQLSGKFLKSFGVLVPDQTRNGLLLDGHLREDGEGGFIYALYRAGVLVRYSSEGVCHYAVETVDPLPLPQLERFTVGESQVTRIDPKAPYAILSVAIQNGRIYLLSRSSGSPKNRQSSIIDVYTIATGDYLYSFTVPGNCIQMDIKKFFLYCIDGDGTLTQWKIVGEE